MRFGFYRSISKVWELKQIPITKNECLKIRNVTESVGTTWSHRFQILQQQRLIFTQKKIIYPKHSPILQKHQCSKDPNLQGQNLETKN
ncbi:hypothetical protein FF021_20110 [Leptospira noguchii]|nr:hypothetical protein FF021_20110 [Leptospira noguchii]